MDTIGEAPESDGALPSPVKLLGKFTPMGKSGSPSKKVLTVELVRHAFN